MKERDFQSSVIKELRNRFPGCIITKNDPKYLQGIPDITILWHERWATLEFKDSENAPKQPNQPYYVNLMNEMSFSSFIYPENKEEVLDALEQSFKGYA